MIEKQLSLEHFDPVEIYGVNNKYLNLFKSRFPKVKAVARGSQINVEGSEKDIEAFEAAFSALLSIKESKGAISEYDIDFLFEEEGREAEVGKVDMHTADDYIIVYGNEGKCIKARTRNQKRLVKEYYDNDLIFALGPAGTGKTYTAIALAVRALKNREVKRLILTRPAVEAGERLGFLPGDLKEKLDPYLQPLYDALQDMIPAKRLQSFMEDGTIQIAPLAYMRGRTLDDSFIILDEAQNTTPAQMKMFLSNLKHCYLYGGNFSELIDNVHFVK